MKREAIGHTKMKRLCRSLDIRSYAAVGLMESFWHLTAKEAPQGDIGKLSNQDIADAIGWEGPEEKLIESLVDARWVDQDPALRLIVHDWSEHCEDSVHMRLARLGLLFANGTKPKTNRLPPAEREKAEAIYGTACARNTHDKRLPSKTTGHVFDRKFSPDTAPLAKAISLENKENGDRAHGVRTESAPPCLTLPSHALPSQASPHHALPDLRTACAIAPATNGASAILKSSSNGKTSEPSDTELDAFSVWAHQVYERHPRQKNLHDTLWILQQRFAHYPADRQIFDENHPLWIEYWKLDPSYPRFVPGLADHQGRGWINDQAWRKKPPPPPDTRTKNQIANDAVYQKLLAQAEIADKERENRK